MAQLQAASAFYYRQAEVCISPDATLEKIHLAFEPILGKPHLATLDYPG